ncbi:hypothetical protein AXG93_3348s1150 [Marchantia polymorpha subsp. ruderalis]|uniref:Uncharacterized protein n=1 Tax=Marchantia polymorpha subsp. ruderalis TaxID=1480154 RepID=A0A176VP75_MARPO|nr:hypothetical protein AXG93_3348s1150 [Marchantia polymorpha subsp. ruderalis]
MRCRRGGVTAQFARSNSRSAVARAPTRVRSILIPPFSAEAILRSCIAEGVYCLRRLWRRHVFRRRHSGEASCSVRFLFHVLCIAKGVFLPSKAEGKRAPSAEGARPKSLHLAVVCVISSPAEVALIVGASFRQGCMFPPKVLRRRRSFDLPPKAKPNIKSACAEGARRRSLSPKAFRRGRSLARKSLSLNKGASVPGIIRLQRKLFCRDLSQRRFAKDPSTRKLLPKAPEALPSVETVRSVQAKQKRFLLEMETADDEEALGGNEVASEEDDIALALPSANVNKSENAIE